MSSITILERTPRAMPAGEPSLRMSLADARQAGSVSLTNGKMPGSSYATDSFACHVGNELAKVPGSVCAACYARRLQAYRRSVQVAWPRNLALAREGIATDPELWARRIAHQVSALALLSGEPWHRWFDGGDLDSIAMLKAIVRVAELTPDIRHWLPTREVAIVRAFIASGGTFPANLVVRISSPMVDDPPLPAWAHTSTVHRHRELGAHEVACQARTRGNVCGPCRACWDGTVRSVSYPKH
jgi:hypothetical protein